MALAYYAISVKPSRESAVAARIPRPGFTVHLPVAHETRSRYGRAEQYAVHLFPGYVFARWDAAVDDPSHIYRIPDVWKILCTAKDKTPIAIPDYVIDEFMGRDRAKQLCGTVTPTFKVGQRVRIVDGPFAGFDGMFDGDGGKRSQALLAYVANIGRNKMRIGIPKASLAAA